MSSTKTILRNTAWLAISNIITSILGFVIIVLIARFLGDTTLGIYSFAMSFVVLFVSLSDFGIRIFMTREVVRDKTKTDLFFGNVLGFKLVMGIIAFIIPTALIFFVEENILAIKVVIIVGLATFFEYYALAYRSIFGAYEKMEYEAIARIITKFVVFFVGGLLLYFGYGMVAFAFALLLSYIIYFCILKIVYLKKIGKISLKFDYKFWKYLLKKSLPFWFTAVFINMYFKVSNIMLPLMQNYEVTGWYNAALKLVDGLYFIPFIVSMATFPAMSRLFLKNRNYLKLLYERTFKYIFIIAFPIGVGTLLLANRMILFIYKEEFAQSSIALQILIWAEVFIFVNYIIGNFLNSINKQKLFAYSTGICLVLCIILNLILIPKFSYIGASVSMVIVEFVNFIILYYFSARNNFKLHLFRLTYKPITAGLIMGIFIIYLNFLHILLLIPLSAAIYFIILFLFKDIGKEEINLIKEIRLKG